MKRTTLFLLLIAMLQYAKAETVLKPGDIAIVQINKAYDSFDFVPLVPITTGTKIVFSDMKYSAALKGFIPFGNPQYTGFHTFTATQDYAAGTVIQSYGNLSESKKILFNGTTGLSIIAFQPNDTTYVGIGEGGGNVTVPKDTTFLTAIGWLTAENFKAGINDIPPGLSVANNTVVKFDSTETYFNKYAYYSIKFDNMGYASKQEGTAIQLRLRFADVSNYLHSSSTIQNTAVANFNVLQPDVTPPALVSSYPFDNKLNTSINGIGFLKFNEPVTVHKSLILKNASSDEIVKTYTSVDLEIEKDSTVKFNLFPYLVKSASYSLTIPKDYLSDFEGNSWPKESLTYNFATSANKSTIECCFPDNSGIIINPIIMDCEAKDDLNWTTILRTVDEYGNDYCSGYYSWTMSGLPMKYYMIEPVDSVIYVPEFPKNGLWSTNNKAKLVVDLSGITHNITDITSHVYDNYSAFFQRSYSGGSLVNERTFSGRGTRGNLHFENDISTKLDSVIFEGFEGRVISFKLEIIDKFPPVVELGNAKTICDGDSVQLDAGLTLGALYDWSTGAKTQKIWTKTSGNYSVTVKNSLGQASDNVQVTVKPVITLSMPDTIYACVGDTVTLTAGTDLSNSYFWSPAGQTTPSIKVTKSGIYQVLVNNAFGGCFTTDSTRVIFNGAKLRAYHFQGGSYGPGDVLAELYRKNADGKFSMCRQADMLQSVQFDSLPKGEYILKSRFVAYSFVGENPWMDTYHDGKTEWKNVTPFKLTCVSDTLIGFLIALKPVFEFNGTAVISGKIEFAGTTRAPLQRIKSAVIIDCETHIVLYNAAGDIIATTCPDSNGNFSFANLPAGNYSVGIERTGFSVQSLFATNLTEGATVTNADFTVDIQAQTVKRGVVSSVAQFSSNSLKVSLSPNPSVDKVSIRVEIPIESDALLSVYDISGRIIQKLNVRLLSGINTIPMSVQGLSGVYFVRLSTDVGAQLSRLIVN